jgi:hypothetical protein
LSTGVREAAADSTAVTNARPNTSRQALKVFAWQPVGSYTGEWAWLNYTGRWGNPKSGCFFSEALSGECVLNNGPEGPPRKSLFDPHMQPLDGEPGLQ